MWLTTKQTYTALGGSTATYLLHQREWESGQVAGCKDRRGRLSRKTMTDDEDGKCKRTYWNKMPRCTVYWPFNNIVNYFLTFPVLNLGINSIGMSTTAMMMTRTVAPEQLRQRHDERVLLCGSGSLSFRQSDRILNYICLCDLKKTASFCSEEESWVLANWAASSSSSGCGLSLRRPHVASKKTLND